MASGEIDEIRSMATPLRTSGDLDPLIERIGPCRFVLLGEASHGTSEYYGWRAAITRRLISEHGFSNVAVEGDWPDCFRVNRWVKGHTDDARAATDVLERFDRWPTWMWANREVAAFAQWLRRHNERTGAAVGFYGLDVYSLWESLRVLLSYLGEHEPDALATAHEALRCFEPFAEDPQRYARATRMVPTSCENKVIDLLVELRSRVGDGDGVVPAGMGADGRADPELALDALQNAEVLAGAERYYRTMVLADEQSWNVRDCHMVDTLDRLVEHHGPQSKVIVWEHNTHIGDARATDMASVGMVNVGQLVRERHDAEGVALVGFGGHRGHVIAADQWGSTMRSMPVPPAPHGTHEQLLHDALGEDSLLLFPDRRDSEWLTTRRGHRAIGVVYRPDRDAWGNWVPTVMGRRYDAFLSFDDTHALHPLHAEHPQPHAELETFPWSE
jgi:erythromycin esterase-like protein